MKTSRLQIPLLIVLAVLSLDCGAQTSQKEITESLRNKLFMMRGFPSENSLSYSAEGEPLKVIKSTSWTLSGIRIEKVDFGQAQTTITGERIGFSLEEGIKLREWRLGKKLVLKVATDLSSLGKEQFAVVFYKLFLRSDEDWAVLVPEYWRSYMQYRYAMQHGTTFDGKSEKEVDMPTVQQVEAGVSPPKPTFSPAPPYSEPARQAKFQGVVVIHLTVDPAGLPTNVRIQQMLGLGLDEQAAETVRRWRFKPAIRAGVPVPVAINVEVNFNLY